MRKGAALQNPGHVGFSITSIRLPIFKHTLLPSPAAPLPPTRIPSRLASMKALTAALALLLLAAGTCRAEIVSPLDE